MNKRPDKYPLFTYLAASANAPILASGKLVIDNFAGGGGASTGLEQAFGRPVDIAINHDPEAIAMHQANHPYTTHYCESVWDIDPRKVVAGRPVALAWFSPDCFPAGTLVLTRKGYCAIETINLGDEVLTHKLRWRKVVETHQTTRPLQTIRGHGHPGLTVSPEHPFYARRRVTDWDNCRHKYSHSLEPADWVPASVMDKGWYWATPRDFPTAEVPEVPGRGLEIDERLMWLAGYYLGNGWTRLTNTRAELVLTCGKRDKEIVRPFLECWPRIGERCQEGELAWSERHTLTAYQFAANHRGLVTWLREHFGHGAADKGLPAWALGMPERLRQELLDGYLAADGYQTSDFVEATTVSKTLAFGIKALANSLGKTVTVYLKTQTSTTIQGRAVNTLPIYQLRWRHQASATHSQTEVEAGLEWTPVREQTDTSEFATVYNIGVEEDESYVVEGIIVHNCKHFSKAAGKVPKSKKIRGLAWIAVRWAATVRPEVICVENVEEFKTWGPLDKDGNPCPKRKGKTFEHWKASLEKLGYQVDYREMVAADYGAPTSRNRLFIVARCDGLPIVWPEPTHGAPTNPRVKSGELQPYRTVAECIDWSEQANTIFGRKKPLAPKTLNRISAGILRFTLQATRPFVVEQRAVQVVPQTHNNAARAVAAPLNTITTQSNAHTLVGAALAPCYSERPGQQPRAQSVQRPAPTITAGGNGTRLASCTLIKTDNQRSRSSCVYTLEQQLFTVTGKNNAAIVSATLVTVNHSGAERIYDLDNTIYTLTAKNGSAIVTANLTTFYGQKQEGEARGQEVQAGPVKTITSGGNRHALTTMQLVKHNSGFCRPEQTGRSMMRPAPTIMATGAPQYVTSAQLVQFNRNSKGFMPTKPTNTMTTKPRFGLSCASMIRQFGTSKGADVDAPLLTITTGGAGAKNGLVLAQVEPDLSAEQRIGATRVYEFLSGELGEKLDPYADHEQSLVLVRIDGATYAMTDIAMRMLQPRELYRAQGFPETYQIDFSLRGKPLSKEAQVRMCGNSVPPPFSRALALANIVTAAQEAAD